jgi:hypothetical protein
MTDDSLHGTYDCFADVLYLTVGAKPGVRFDEDDDGLIWRYRAGADYPSGVTVREFQTFWAPGSADLVRKIARACHKAEPLVRTVIMGLIARGDQGRRHRREPQAASA